MSLFASPAAKMEDSADKKKVTYQDLYNILPYYDLFDNYLVDKFGCVSSFYLLDAPSADVATATQLFAIQQSLVVMLEKLPEFIVQQQFIYCTNGQYKEMIIEHAQLHSTYPTMQLLRNLRSERLLAEEKDHKLTRPNCIMVITCGPRAEMLAERDEEKGFSYLKNTLNRAAGVRFKVTPRILTETDFAEAASSLKTTEVVVADSLSKVGIRLKQMTAEDIADFFYRLFNQWQAVDIGLPLNYDYDSDCFTDAWVCNGVQWKGDCFYWGKYWHGSVSMLLKPKTSKPRLIERITTDLPFKDVRVTVTVRKTDKDKEIDALLNKQQLSIGKRNASMNILDRIPGAKPNHVDPNDNIIANEEIKEVNELVKELRSNQDTLVQCQVVVHFWHQDRGELTRRREVIISRIANMNRARPWNEEESLRPVFISSLPGAYTELERGFKIKGRMAADLIPLHRGLESDSSPVCMMRNATGGLVSIDLFDRGETDAGLGFVMGGTGSGKTYLVQSLVCQHMCSRRNHEGELDQNPLLLVLDVGGSYDLLGHQFNAQSLKFNMDSPQCFNPMQAGSLYKQGEEPSDADRTRIMANIKALLMANEDSPLLKDSEKNILDDCLMSTFAQAVKSRQSVVVLSDLVNVMGQHSEAQGMVTRLKKFCVGGEFGKWVDGPGTFDWKGGALIFDFKGIDRTPVLARAMIPIVLNMIYQICFYDKARRKIVIFDEFWKYIANNEFAVFIEETWKTIRKQNGAVLAVSQSMTDIERNETIAAALKSNTENWFLLDMPIDEANMCKHVMSLTDGQMDLLKNLRRSGDSGLDTGEAPYRECLFIRGRGKRMKSGKIRIQAMPEERWLWTTDPEENREREKVITMFQGDEGKAIEYLSKKYPRGLRK